MSREGGTLIFYRVERVVREDSSGTHSATSQRRSARGSSTHAGSLGGPENCIRHAASVMHPADGMPDDLLRVSVGLEDPNDLAADLEQALG